MTTNPDVPNSLALSPMRTIEPATFGSAATMVPRGARFEGSVSSAIPQALRIDGEFKGRHLLLADGAVHIGPGATIECEEMQADVIYVQGFVKGNIHARKVLEVGPSAKIMGDLQYDAKLDVHAGARLRGAIKGPEAGI